MGNSYTRPHRAVGQPPLRMAGAALLCVALLGIALPSQVAAAATSITSSATVNPVSVTLGSGVTINASFTSSAAASNVSLDVEVRDGAGGKIFQQLFAGQSFNAGETRTVTSTWTTPTYTAGAGIYVLKLGAFSSDYQTSYGWNDSAALVQVTSGSTQNSKFSSTVTANPNQVAPGGTTNLSVTFTSSGAINGVNLDLEVRDTSNGQVFQQLYFNQSFGAGQSQNYSATWAVASAQAAGTYTIKTGVFSPDWSVSYGWNDNAGPITIGGSGGGTGTTYYLDCAAGNDGFAGTSQGQAWQSIGRANQASLKPGQSLLLKGGCVWTGPLNASWSGTASQPITIGMYGGGALPKIQNTNPFQIRITGSYLIFDHLWVRADPDFLDSSCNNNRIGYREGFYFDNGSSFNVVQNSYMSDLGGGLEIATGSHNNSVHNNEFASNNMMYDSDQFRNDGGGAAIVVFGDNNDIGYNSMHDSTACSLRYQGGITGHAFDIEAGQNNVFHHNRAWADGANFAELVNAVNDTFAYNIAYNSFTNHTNSRGTKLYNNVFYLPNAGILTCQGCSLASMAVRNNIFYGNTGVYADGPLDESYNLYWNGGNFVYNTQALSSTSKIADPQFLNAPGADFHVQSSSPAINAGTLESVNNGFRVDNDGHPVPQGGAVDIGAYEIR